MADIELAAVLLSAAQDYVNKARPVESDANCGCSTTCGVDGNEAVGVLVISMPDYLQDHVINILETFTGLIKQYNSEWLEGIETESGKH